MELWPRAAAPRRTQTERRALRPLGPRSCTAEADCTPGVFCYGEGTALPGICGAGEGNYLRPRAAATRRGRQEGTGRGPAGLPHKAQLDSVNPLP